MEEIATGMPGEAVQVRALDPRYDLRCHSPDGFNWGFCGSGSAQLALAILADATGNDALALSLYPEFQRHSVGHWRDRWSVERDTVQTWVTARQQHLTAAEQAALDEREAAAGAGRAAAAAGSHAPR